MLACYNNPDASVVAIVSAGVDVIAAIGFSWFPAVVMVFAVAAIPAAVVVLYAIDIPGVPAVAKVSAVATAPTAVDVIYTSSDQPVCDTCCCWRPCYGWHSYCG